MFSSLKTKVFGGKKQEPEPKGTPEKKETQEGSDEGVWDGETSPTTEEGVTSPNAQEEGHSLAATASANEASEAEIKQAASDIDQCHLVSVAEDLQIDEMLTSLNLLTETQCVGVTTGIMPEEGKEEEFYLRRKVLRFLRARRHVVKDALKMYEAAEKWRADNDVANIPREDPHEPMYQCLCPHRFHGFDTQGHPVYIERTGAVRVEECLKHVTEDAMVNRHIVQMEYYDQLCKRASKMVGRTVEKVIIILDVKGIPMGPNRAGMRIFRRTTAIDQNYYPERLHKIFFINAPMTFRGLWAISKPWLNKVTQAKVQIIGGAYQDRLKTLIPNERIPIEYGGTCDCTGRTEENGPNSCLAQVRKYPEEEGNAPKGWNGGLPVENKEY